MTNVTTPDIKWVHEEVLQRYIKENPQKWRIDGKKVLTIKYNSPFNRYPDLFFTVEDEENQIPVEVEWRSSDFDHDINILKNGNGCVFVCYKDEENLGVPQYQIPHEGFLKWFKANSERLLEDTIKDFKEPAKRKTPKLWIQYIGLRGGAISDYKIALEAQTWGIPKNSSALNKFQDIKKGDLIMFVIKGKNFPGRVKPKIWHKKSFRGKFEKIQVFRITSDYFYDEEKIIWERSTRREIWPHRFNFDELNSKGKHPLLDLNEIEIKKMAEFEKEQLRIVVSANFIEGDHSTLVECMHYSKQI